MDSASHCTQHKFRPGMGCQHEQYQTAWIPGWKEHRLRGRLLGSFLVHLLMDSLVLLDNLAMEVTDIPATGLWKAILNGLDDEDKQDQFVSEVSQTSHAAIGTYSEGLDDLSDLLNKPAKCVLLPPSSDPAPQPENTTITNSSDLCPKIDYGYRKRSHILSEGQSFNFSLPATTVDESVIMLCFRTCAQDGCGDTLPGLDSVKIENNNVDIEVDGVRVASSRDMDSCHVLVRDEGVALWPPPAQDGDYTISISLNEPGGSLHLFSALIL
mmetsp:Transcript_45735/g.68027  ORF Transcript_45735/g.68027 Transcript_45735/m.68027 type:complete len:269 (-) Transcript_45735:824-1630(-)